MPVKSVSGGKNREAVTCQVEGIHLYLGEKNAYAGETISLRVCRGERVGRKCENNAFDGHRVGLLLTLQGARTRRSDKWTGLRGFFKRDL